ncbi:alpha-1,2-fucosyltransferase [Candidatus Planktophila dulcis]|uniref:alpha-1,2-fucosyltransferase n=1 Tax=Candidatus Planktophila dulcis TaxID=1884914 RepID=UPI003CEDD2CA
MDSSHANGFKGDDLYSQLDQCDHVQLVARKDLVGFVCMALDKASTLNAPLTTLLEKQLGALRTKDSYFIPEFPTTMPKLVTGFFINSRNVEQVEEVLHPELQRIISNIEMPRLLPMKYQYVHVRRGDYVTSDPTYGLIGANHYRRFIREDLPLVVGTDDVSSAASLIADLNPDFVFSPSDSTAWQALKMMALAESLVLANSTLSWWGGFLASNRGKTVYSPSPFYRGDFKNDDVLQYKKFTKVDSRFL